MDINTLRGIGTILCMLGFAAVCWWAYSPSRKGRFEEAANLPFADDDYARKDYAHENNKEEDHG